MKVLLLEPYYTGSHASWADGFAENSKHKVKILSLSGHYWKWRMHGGAVTLARKFSKLNFKPDIILATDMLDLTTFLSLTRNKTGNIPTAIYFHENQLSYPWSPTDRDVIKQRDVHYGFINYASALTADLVLFNSKYHMASFLNEAQKMLKHFPDNHELDSVKKIKRKSKVLPLGLNLNELSKLKSDDTAANSKPLILWNHRWEYDKNPEEFFKAMYVLDKKGLDFEIAILGENFANKPAVFLSAKKRLKHRIVHFGYAKNKADYARWLWKADILPVTSIQDFFGISIVEAMYCNCYPILPERLSYPELISKKNHKLHLYRDFEGLINLLKTSIQDINKLKSFSIARSVEKYNWSNIIAKYDSILENCK